MISSQSQNVEKPEDHCNKILAKIDPDKNMWRFGKTKVSLTNFQANLYSSVKMITI